jgi:hypothetical protein
MKRWVRFLVSVVALGLSVSPALGQNNAPAVETAKVVAQMLDKTVTIPADLTPFQGVNIHARSPASSKTCGSIAARASNRGRRWRP